MAEPRTRGVGPGERAAGTLLLPDLTDVDLRALRAMDDPALMAAVGEVFADSRHGTEIWYSDEGGRFSAGLAEAMPGEDIRE
ncbi:MULTISPECIES: hypothetical protein [unclassified Streptomyces]|uniref:hypothetical protein n=1 Tax=unclassified Streptomyces TaxID=2593676 RepID=UPI0011AD2EE2|nr:hypothetical protein [Streptomyces sp. BK340]TVZ87414.1 FXSXX-COOH protein [Streptomyces sp. BK340]